jgi:hypothetical protein
MCCSAAAQPGPHGSTLHPAGAHVGSSFSGLAQCCQLMALPASGLHTALKQLHMQQQGSSSGCCGRHSSSTHNPSVDAAAQAAEGQMPSSGSSGSCCRNATHSSAKSNCPAAKFSSDNSTAAAGIQHSVTLEATSTAAAAAALPQTLGCCCSHAGSPQPQTGQQWACGAAAHRLQAMQGSTACKAAPQRDHSTVAFCAPSCMPTEVRS